MAGWERRDFPRLRRRLARESTPSMGLLEEIWKPSARASVFRSWSPFPIRNSVSYLIQPPQHEHEYLPSTIGPLSFFAANPKFLNIYKLATAIPSLLSYSFPAPGSTYRQWSPAPASNSTETKNRSISRRVSSSSSHPCFFHSSRRSAMRGTPPTSKCCQRP